MKIAYKIALPLLLISSVIAVEIEKAADTLRCVGDRHHGLKATVKALKLEPLPVQTKDLTIRMISGSGWMDMALTVRLPGDKVSAAAAEFKYIGPSEIGKQESVAINNGRIDAKEEEVLRNAIASCTAFEKPEKKDNEPAIDAAWVLIEVRDANCYKWFYREGVQTRAADCRDLVGALMLQTQRLGSGGNR